MRRAIITDPTHQLVVGLVVVLVGLSLILLARRLQQFALQADDSPINSWHLAIRQWARKHVYGDPMYPLSFQICGAVGVLFGLVMIWEALHRG